MYHLIRATGHAEGWSVAFYFFTFIRGILFFTVVVLIGTGWSYLKVSILCRASAEVEHILHGSTRGKP